MAHTTSAFFLLLLFSVAYSVTTNNGGQWGDWGPTEICPYGYKVRGVSVKVEAPKGSGDDTAVNAIRFHCFNRYNYEVNIQSTEGPWGNWSPMVKCPRNTHVVSYQIKVEPPQGDEDDTALNNIKIRCSNGMMLKPIESQWGTYGSWSAPCDRGICGLATKVEPSQGRGDDTALNDLDVYCCDY